MSEKSNHAPPPDVDAPDVGTGGTVAAHQKRHAWEHWGWIWSVVFFASLLLPIVLFRVDQELDESAWRRVLLYGAAAIAVHLVGFWGLPRWGTHLGARPLYGILYSIALGLITLALLTIHPSFGLLYAGYFTQLFYALPARSAIPLAMASTVLFGVTSLDAPSLPALLQDPALWLWILAGVCGSLISLWLNAIINQSAERQALIERLHRAQAELARMERASGILEERQRLAREIHDTLAQGLISIITHLETADQALDSDPAHRNNATLQHHLKQAQNTARSNLREARRVVQDLRPDVLVNQGLPDAMRRTVAAWQADSGIAAAIYITGVVTPLATEIEVTLVRVLQEALANVAKHAHAQQVNVTLSYMSDRILLDVQDDGDGLHATTPDPRHSMGFGLQSMRERVTNLGGTLNLESEPGSGTTLVIEAPLTLQLDQALRAVPAATTAARDSL